MVGRGFEAEVGKLVVDQTGAEVLYLGGTANRGKFDAEIEDY